MQDIEKDYIFQEEEFDLKKYLYIIFTKRWILFSIVSIIMAMELIYTFKQTPVYQATSLVLIERPASSLSLNEMKGAVTPDIRTQDYYSTQYEILKSRMLAKRVVKALKLESLEEFKGEFPENKFQKMTKVMPVRNTRLVNVNMEYKDPIMATKMVNTLVSLYIEQNIENMLFMSKEILKTFPEDASEIERSTVYGQLKDLTREETIESLPSIINNQILQQLKMEKITVQIELANLSKRYKEKHPKIIALDTKLKFIEAKIEIETNRILSSLRADLAGSLQANNIRVIDYAEVPKVPIKPQKMKNIILGFFFSVFLGIGVIFFTEYLDDSIKNEEDVEDRLSLPYLGAFPILLKNISTPLRLIEIDKDAYACEAIRNIKTNIIFSMPKDKLKTILVTSTLPQEGKSFLTGYISFSLAKNGFKTLLIDGDIRKPRLHKLFEVDQVPGLVNLLVEHLSPDDVIKKTPYDNLYILPSGSKTPNPPELLSSDKINKLFEELSGKFEKIVIDTPPSFNISDALILSKLANAIILITRSGAVSEKIMNKMKEKFDAVGSKPTGVIINFSSMEKSSYYNYKYHHKYYKDYYSSDPREYISSSTTKNKDIV